VGLRSFFVIHVIVGGRDITEDSFDSSYEAEEWVNALAVVQVQEALEMIGAGSW